MAKFRGAGSRRYRKMQGMWPMRGGVPHEDTWTCQRSEW